MKKLFLAIVLLSVAACTGTKALYKHADSPVSYAKVVLLHHNALGTAVADLRADPTVSEGSKVKLLQGYRVTVCSASELSLPTATAACRDGPAQKLEAAARAYEAVQSAKTDADLQAALTKLVGLITQLVTTIHGVK